MRSVSFDPNTVEFFTRKTPGSIARATLGFSKFQVHLIFSRAGQAEIDRATGPLSFAKYFFDGSEEKSPYHPQSFCYSSSFILRF